MLYNSKNISHSEELMLECSIMLYVSNIVLLVDIHHHGNMAVASLFFTGKS